MYKLINRIAWIISIIISLQFSFLVDSDGPFDDDGFWIFIITLFLVKFFILSGRYIESRLEFFADSLSKKPLSGILSPSQEKEATIIKKEIIEQKDIVKNIAEEKPKKIKTEIIQEEPSKIALAIKAFFSENLLAKLGGIFVFLGVLFLLGLVYSGTGPVQKLIIGFVIGFGIYIAGVFLDQKGYNNEGRILLGVGILINFLVILSGRYLIGEGTSSIYLTEGTTFLFLIFNTVFAIVTSLVYKSRTLLLFSFIFAFINPLLIGGSSENPYTLVGYSLILSFGGLFLSLKQKDIVLAIGVFILANILFLIAPFNSDLHWIVKLFSSTIVSIGTIFIVYNLDKNQLGKLFFGSYLFLMFLLGSGESYIGQTTSFISYMVTILLYFGIGIYYFLKTSMNSLIYLLISPILIILGVSLNGDTVNITSSLIAIVFIYLIGFNFIQSKLPNSLKYVFFIVLGAYIFFSNALLSLDSVSLDLYSFLSVIIVSFIFIFTSYFLSSKKDLEFLYAIGTIGGIFMLAPVIQEKLISGNNISENIIQVYFSAAAVILFAISKWILPFINKNFFEEKRDVKNLVIGTIAGLLFLGYELFIFGSNYFQGISLGFAFAFLAIFYFVLAFIIVDKIGIEKVKEQQESKNIISLYIGASISLFTLSIALIFSDNPSIICAVWLFEATILFFFYNKINEIKIFIFGIILFMIGLSKFALLIDSNHLKEFILLIPLSLIFISFILNIRFLNFVKSGGIRVSHDVLHILGMGILGILLLEIIPSTGLGWSTFGIALFLGTMSFVYSYYDSKILKTFYIIGLTGFFILQIGELDSVFGRIYHESLGNLKALQYISTIITGIIVFVWNKINKQKSLNVFVDLIFATYLLIITSLYIHDIFNTTFAVTIYWGITASILLFNGIARDNIKLRTIGLYLIILTSGKIFLYDIWFGIDDAISRVVALILIGILFIVISTRYTKKYGNNISGEFNMGNLVGNVNNEDKSNEDKNNEDKSRYEVNESIKDIDVSMYNSVKLKINNGENIQIRAKNLIRISKLIIDSNKKTVFKKGELNKIYNFIISNYKTDLSKVDYEKVIKIVKSFVDNGGEIELIKK